MGTNYYEIPKSSCLLCRRPYEKIHLGKSSSGWKFSLQLNGRKFYHDKDSMKEWTRRKKIVDEYGHRISWKGFWELIELKQESAHPNGEDVAEYPSHYIFIDKYVFHDSEFS